MSNYWRRLPIYLLLDCSESMAGDAFYSLKNSLNAMIGELKTNPTALETVTISIITFSNQAKQIVPLTDLLKLQIPHLVLGSGTAMGSALKLWTQCMEQEVTKTSATQKGDYKPICFILTDGEPTDQWEDIADQVRNNIVGKQANVIGVACGPDADTNKLCRITETVIVLKQTTKSSFSRFFQWISASISTTSERLEKSGKQGISLPKLPEEIELHQPGEQQAIKLDRYVFLHSKCIQNRGFYLLRYTKIIDQIEVLNNPNKPIYQAIAAHPVENFEFTQGEKTPILQVSTRQLLGFQPCPYCNNSVWAMCSNGHVHCCPEYQNSINITCPWCNITDTYYPQNFDVGSGLG
ncbi:MAG: VWA domain-containing protein [Sphaerospermopsis sp. SIO1G1]|nr:VWA domain-containing protein [Sphaerospermopsis sp. SIO1G1]